MRRIATEFQGGLAVRTFPTLLAASLVLVSPALRAQAQRPQPAALAACLTCHGPTAESGPQASGVPPIPRVSGQHLEYLAKQLREYKAGRRKNDLMTPMLQKISSGQLKDLAAHLASQAPVAPAAPNSPLVERGRGLYEQGNAAVPACVGCHQADGVGAPRYPRLAGQRQTYVVQQLMNFKQGIRTNDRARVMRTIAGNLSEEEMQAIAEYLAGLQGK
jgi:cytochrome c553